MDVKIAFDKSLYGGKDISSFEIFDEEFLVDRIVKYPAFRPFQLDKTVNICFEYCKNSIFKEKLLEKTKDCIVLVYRLFLKGVYNIDDLQPSIHHHESYLLCYYFKKWINDFESLIINKIKPYNNNDSYFENEDHLDLLIEYGFHPTSIEYCLKYDDIECFRKFDLLKNWGINWSPFEWSIQPDYLDLISFSGFYGSINCFKYLLVNGYQINENIFSMVVCSGSSNLFNLCYDEIFNNAESLCQASKFGHLQLINYMIDNGADINIPGYKLVIGLLNRHPFTGQLIMVICVLLNPS